VESSEQWQHLAIAEENVFEKLDVVEDEELRDRAVVNDP